MICRVLEPASRVPHLGINDALNAAEDVFDSPETPAREYRYFEGLLTGPPPILFALRVHHSLLNALCP